MAKKLRKLAKKSIARQTDCGLDGAAGKNALESRMPKLCDKAEKKEARVGLPTYVRIDLSLRNFKRLLMSIFNLKMTTLVDAVSILLYPPPSPSHLHSLFFMQSIDRSSGIFGRAKQKDERKCGCRPVHFLGAE